jgi:hypothetical protein
MFGPKRSKVTEDWRRLDIEEFYDIGFSLNMIQQNK